MQCRAAYVTAYSLVNLLSASLQYQDEDMFPSLMGTKGAVEAFPHNAAAMEPASATGADLAKEEEPDEARPTPELASITA